MAENNNLIALSALAAGTLARNPMPAEVYRGSGCMPEMDPAPAPVPLSHYLWLLKRHWWKILLLVVCLVSAALVVSFRLVPIYESTVTVDIDREMPSAVIGQESTRPMANDADQFLATQIKLIQSDAVLRPVAQQYKLSNLEA